MRARNIKPGLFKDGELAELPIEVRYLFAGLWCLADCKGRLEDHPKVIKAEVFPYDDIPVAKIHQMIQQLADGGFVQRYEVGRRRYIFVINFEKHQNPHKQERDKGSQLPCPPLVEVLPVLTGVIPESTPVDNGVKPEVVPVETGVTPDDSLFLIPDSLIPDSRFIIPENGKRKPASLAPARPPPPEISTRAPAVTLSRFNEWIKPWPRVPNEEHAIQAFVFCWTAEEDDAIFACTERYLASAEVADGALTNPEKFLNEQKRNQWRGKWPKVKQEAQNGPFGDITKLSPAMQKMARDLGVK